MIKESIAALVEYLGSGFPVFIFLILSNFNQYSNNPLRKIFKAKARTCLRMGI
ncbi:hypothetical protein MYP_3253 [Sporocytophaga myxococcoides]|uniref:Uncharacterized protein n=1 Tax=Sporocytophaga myxococcoides TaxID=153721 RepID=A0A098LHU9_9BACT|nr:hypothetical protein MYP_3253 [Sporocytophaga myxococcoides]